MLVVNERLKIPLSEFEFTFVRSQGPGGQNVNKVNSKAVLRWAVQTSPSLPESVRRRFVKRYSRRMSKEGDLLITSQRFRDQGRNVADCLAKLREMLAEAAIVPKPRKKTKPSHGSKLRRKKNKQINARKKQLRKPPKNE